MRNHGYWSVVNTWTYDPELIVYVSVRCLAPHSYPSPLTFRPPPHSFTYVTPACLCKNNDHAFSVESTTRRGPITENYFRCQLEELSPVMFEGLEQLEVLDLSHNLLEHLERHGFHSLSALKVLSLHNNPLRRLPEGLTCSLNSLEVLDISHLQLVTFPGHVFGCDGNSSDVSVLRWLDVGRAHISNVPAGSFWYLGNLQFLNMSDNLVRSLPPHPFLGAFSLQAIDLSRNLLSSLPEEFCEGIPQLNELLLTDNMFESVELTKLEACGNLTRLDLSSNMMAEMKGPPVSLPLLRELNLAHNQLHALDGALIGPECGLRVLDLSHNNLHRLEDSVFDNMINLVNLSMAGNSLKEETFDLTRVFQNLTRLEVLNASGNLLTSLNESDCAGLTSLKVLDLSHNRIASVSLGTDTPLSQVTHLNLSGNMLTSLTPDVIVHLASLKVVDLSDNLLHHVAELHVPQALLTLDLSRNSLRSVPVFRGASGLRVLRLSRNSITTLMQLNELQGLQELDLSHNTLSHIHPDAFTALSNLRVLEVAHNRLALNDSHGGQVFAGMEKLEVLNLSHNRLTDVQGLFLPGSFAALLELDVSHNAIGQITTRLNQWNHTMHLQHVNLESCKLREVSADAFGDLIYLRTVSLQNNLLTRVPLFRDHVGVTYRLQGNPITCSCHVAWLKENVVRVLGQEIPTRHYSINFCRVVPRGYFHPIRLVDRRDFLCRTETACPDNCTCYSQREAGDAEEVFCTGSLTSVPALLPQTARVISLEDNDLGEVVAIGESSSQPLAVEELYLNSSRVRWIAEDAFTNLSRLHTLSLSNNHLTELPAALFSSLSSLTSLSLNNNELESLPEGLFSERVTLERLDLSHNFLEVLEPSTVQELRALESLHEVRLSSNPWQCGCANSDMYHWVTENVTRVVDYEDMVCADRQGQPMVILGPSLFDCEGVDDGLSFAEVVGIIAGAVAGVALLVALYRFRSVVAAILYTRLGVQGVRPSSQRAPLGLLYDVSVLYDHSDRKCRWWVERVLLPRLTSSKWRLRVHIPRAGETRAAGGSVVESAVYSVRQSASCLVLASKYFGAHHHTVTCFHQALNQEHTRPCSLVLVTWGELTKQTLECGVRQFLGRRQHLPITAPFFWDRLLYLLPAPPRPVSAQNLRNNQ
nr:hypothetical protein BaRGS_016225 [Batillaria attramentaria]